MTSKVWPFAIVHQLGCMLPKIYQKGFRNSYVKGPPNYLWIYAWRTKSKKSRIKKNYHTIIPTKTTPTKGMQLWWHEQDIRKKKKGKSIK